jgi:hypothetical protein
MEISRKKITDAEIHAAEAKLAAEIEALCEEFSEKFGAFGCELVTEFSRDNENFEDADRDALKATELCEPCDYSFGYTSGVKITVKRKKDESEAEAEEAVSAEGLSEEEAELLESERMLEKAKKEAARDVAFTSMYFAHIYKAFWRESVSMSDDTAEVRADLEEFLAFLAEKAESAEEAVEE